jgi:hypothetical protein
MRGRVRSSGTLPIKTLLEKLWEKPSSGYAPYTLRKAAKVKGKYWWFDFWLVHLKRFVLC